MTCPTQRALDLSSLSQFARPFLVYCAVCALMASTAIAAFSSSTSAAAGETGSSSRDVARGLTSLGGSIAESRPIVDVELVRNGGFERDAAGWAVNGIGTHTGDGYGKNGVGKGMQIWPEFEDPNVGFAYQELYLPTQIAAATASLDYQFDPDPGAVMDYFRAAIATESDTLVTLVNVTADVYPGETWQSTGTLTFDQSALDALNTAHAAGERVYVVLQLRAQSLRVNADNVSLTISGSKDVPEWTGDIGYIGLDTGGASKTVKRIKPDGDGERTLWTHPQSGSTNAMYDVAWKPDASELAFVSNHETMYSAFRSDVYGIGPDGTGLRRITNPPSKAALDAGGYQVGTVTGRVYNNYANISSLLLHIQGAREAVSIPATGYQEEATFTMPNVAYLGAGLHYAVFTWSGGGSANCKEYAAAVIQVTPGQTVDAGTLQFGGTCGEYDSSTITWKRDGAEVGVDVITPRRFQASGQAIGTQLFDAPLLADKPAWSPVDERILYYDGTYGEKGIYITRAGEGRGTQLLSDQASTWVTPAWLPDGTGLVYSLDNYLYQYVLGEPEPTPLAFFPGEYVLDPSVSPDGRYVVFELWSGGTEHDLWIVDRVNPSNAWQVTVDGRSTNPDWSRSEPAGASATPTSTATQPNTATPTTVPTTPVPTTPVPPTAAPTTVVPPTIHASATPTAAEPGTPGASPTASSTGGPADTATPTPADDPTYTATPTDAATPADSYIIFLPAIRRGE